MFPKPLGNNPILATLALVAAVWAVPEAGATVIFCERDLCAHRSLGDDPTLWLEIDPVEVARQSSPGGMAGLPIVPVDEGREREQEAQKDRLLRILYGSLMHPPADMSPSSTNSLSQSTGSGGAAAALECTFSPLSPPSLVGCVPPEALLNLPTGPPFELLRPA